MGLLAMLDAGELRLRPMEFACVDGELWTVASRQSIKLHGLHDGQHVEVLLVDDRGVRDRVRGVVHCSTAVADQHRAWGLQHPAIPSWCEGQNDLSLIVVRIIPEDEFWLNP